MYNILMQTKFIKNSKNGSLKGAAMRLVVAAVFLQMTSLPALAFPTASESPLELIRQTKSV